MNRGLPIILSLVVTLVPGVVAFLLNTALGRAVAPSEAPPETGAVIADAGRPTPAPVMPRGKTLDQYLDTLINRNLFDSELHGTWSRSTGEGGEGGPVVSKLDVILLGTLVAEPATLSSALIVEKGKEDWPRGYSIGDELFGHEVVEIQKKRVGLKKPNGTIEWLTMDDAPSRTTTTASTSAGEDDGGDVQQTGDNRFAVDRELFDKYINDIESISRMGRALLHRGPDGEFDGYRLSAIRRNTLADQLGIKNGDVVHSVNDTPLNSVQSAMNAYQTMQNEQNFCFEITRRGQPMELCYDVQ